MGGGVLRSRRVLLGPSHWRAVGQDRVPSPSHDVVLLRGSRLRVDVCHDCPCGGWGGGAERVPAIRGRFCGEGSPLWCKGGSPVALQVGGEVDGMRLCGEEGKRAVARTSDHDCCVFVACLRVCKSC